MSNTDPGFLAALKDATVVAPELPQADAFDILERVRFYERTLVLPQESHDRELVQEDYALGIASYPDQVATRNEPAKGMVASADHATDTIITKKDGTKVSRGAGHGTAGLVRLLAEREDTTAIIPLGQQTGNATEPGNRIKQVMDRLMPPRHGFLSVRGMEPGKRTTLTDTSEIHAIFGLGHHPTEQSRAMAEDLVVVAKDLGLRAIIGNDTRFMRYDLENNTVKRNPNTGEPVWDELAAKRGESTVDYANQLAQAQDRTVSSMQIELTRLLRLVPSNLEGGWHSSEKSRAMGVYMGYQLLMSAVDLASAHAEK